MKIEFLSLESDINPVNDNPVNDNVDVLVRLDDGRAYLFLVATPSSIYSSMENEGTNHHFGVPPLFVRELTRANIEGAITALLGEPKWLELYGRLQAEE